MCKCSLCGEDLTAPVFYNGFIYGYSCAKKLNPNFKKPKEKQIWVESESFNIEPISEYCKKVLATYKNVNFSDFIIKRINTANEVSFHSKGIVISNNTAYINLLSYKGNKIYKLIDELKNNN